MASLNVLRTQMTSRSIVKMQAPMASSGMASLEKVRPKVYRIIGNSAEE